MEVAEKKRTSRLDAVLDKIRKRGFFDRIGRWSYNCDIEESLEIIEAIGKERTPAFVIDNENRFVFENFLKWLHGDNTMKALDPETKQVVPGRLKAGIYIAGNTGTGKSWCLDIMASYSSVCGFKIQFNDNEPQPIWWKTYQVDEICDQYAKTGDIGDIKKRNILAIQDLGREPQETLYMGNRINPVQQILEYRGDRSDQITLITSNFPMKHQLTQDRYGERVVSRLVEMCNYFEIKGKDRRKGI